MKQVFKKDVLIVSLYGRGQWLALECQKKGLDVALLDLTPLMSGWSIEDMEGPFGVFAERHTPSQMARLADEGPLILSDRGYVLWPKSGPLEFKGPLGMFQIKKTHIPDVVIDYLRMADDLSGQFSDLSFQVEHLPFQQNWLAHLAHQISASVFMENTKGLSFGRPLPLVKSFYYRRFHKKIKSSSKQNISDITFLPSFKRNIQIMGSSSRLEGIVYQKNEEFLGKRVVWMLSSQETCFCFGENAQMLFPKGPITPQWYWSKYRIDLKDGDLPECMPDHFVMVEDIVLPWTHDNLYILQKTLREHVFDVWIRLPVSQRFQKEYVQDYGQALCEHLQNRIPSLKPSIQDWPKEVLEENHQLGPCIFGVYDLKDRFSLKRAKLENVIFEGPEVWTSLGWDGQFRSNRRTFKHLLENISSPSDH